MVQSTEATFFFGRDMTDQIYWDENGQPLSAQFNDYYFSKKNGFDETDYVYLQKNKLKERFQHLNSGDVFVIGEMGFGTGLNFLATVALWHTHVTCDAQLHFISLEKYPLNKEELRKSLLLWPDLATYYNELLRLYPDIISGFHRLPFSNNIHLTLIIDDAAEGLKKLLASNHPYYQRPQWQGVDAWFLDGFSPIKNPEMWSEKLLAVIGKLSKSTTTLSTFTAASSVKNGLIHAGFVISKPKGYGSKREMIVGHYHSPTQPPSTQQQGAVPSNISITKAPRKNKQVHDNAPWMLIKNYQALNTPKNIAIIGGGIAGCHSAYALAKKGFNVTIFEKHRDIANGASGNSQGIVYGKLSPTAEPQGEFNLYSLLYAQIFYNEFWSEQEGEISGSQSKGQKCGVLQLSSTTKLQTLHQKIIARFQGCQDTIQYVSAQRASHIANTNIPHPALYFPRLGWLNPRMLCKWLSHHSRIQHIYNTEVHAIERHKESWRLITKATNETNSDSDKHIFDAIVIANAVDANRFEQTRELPIKSIRGQVTHYPSTLASSQLSTVVCGRGYIAPSLVADTQAASNYHCIGASFNLHSHSTQLSPDDHNGNIQHINQQAPELFNNGSPAMSTLDGRVGFRCTTPDYLPIVGAVPVDEAIKKDFYTLRHDAKQPIDQAGQYYPHLYINIGHGSRGLAYTPLSSEILACMISGSPPPIAQDLIHKLNPTRFIIRDIIRSADRKP